MVSTIDEPVPGWLDNFNGPVGLMVGCGLGIMRTIYSNPNSISDYTPCDIAIKGMLIVAWKHGLMYQNKMIAPKTEIPVYNCCTANLKYVTMKEMVDIGKEVTKDVPFDKLSIIFNFIHKFR